MDAPQTEVARIALTAARSQGFVLAGGNALVLHGIGDRPTEDIDLFTNRTDLDSFAVAVAAVISALESAGWHTDSEMRWATYARIIATYADKSVAIDLGIDYRSEPPTMMTVGPVLSLKDAAGSKMATLYSRGYPRDYLDVAKLITSGRFTHEDLLALGDAIEATSMDREVLRDRMRAIDGIDDREFELYGQPDNAVSALRGFFRDWADRLQ